MNGNVRLKKTIQHWEAIYEYSDLAYRHVLVSRPLFSERVKEIMYRNNTHCDKVKKIMMDHYK